MAEVLAGWLLPRYLTEVTTARSTPRSSRYRQLDEYLDTRLHYPPPDFLSALNIYLLISKHPQLALHNL